LQTNQDKLFQDLSRVIGSNKEKELLLDYEKFSMDGCFEAKIAEKMNLNRKGMEEIKKGKRPKYQAVRLAKEEVTDFKEYFKLKKELSG